MSTPDHQHRHQPHYEQQAPRDLLAHDVRVAIARATAASQPAAGAGTTDPLAGVRVARLARDVADGQLREWALRARGAGHSWDEIAAALGLTHDSDDEWYGQRLGELAWEWLIEHRPPLPGGRHGMSGSAVWVCTACRARVRDIGPYAPHLDDRETGHGPACPRQLAALAVHLDELQDENDRDDTGLEPATDDTTVCRRGPGCASSGAHREGND